MTTDLYKTNEPPIQVTYTTGFDALPSDVEREKVLETRTAINEKLNEWFSDSELEKLSPGVPLAIEIGRIDIYAKSEWKTKNGCKVSLWYNASEKNTHPSFELELSKKIMVGEEIPAELCMFYQSFEEFNPYAPQRKVRIRMFTVKCDDSNGSKLELAIQEGREFKDSIEFHGINDLFAEAFFKEMFPELSEECQKQHSWGKYFPLAVKLCSTMFDIEDAQV